MSPWSPSRNEPGWLPWRVPQIRSHLSQSKSQHPHCGPRGAHHPDLISSHPLPIASVPATTISAAYWTHQAHSCHRAFAHILPAWNTTIALCLSPHLSSLLKCHLICEGFLGQPLLTYLFSGCAMQLAGSSFPEQGLNMGPSSGSVES